jgi:hypothetical protein
LPGAPPSARLCSCAQGGVPHASPTAQPCLPEANAKDQQLFLPLLVLAYAFGMHTHNHHRVPMSSGFRDMGHHKPHPSISRVRARLHSLLKSRTAGRPGIRPRHKGRNVNGALAPEVMLLRNSARKHDFPNNLFRHPSAHTETASPMTTPSWTEFINGHATIAFDACGGVTFPLVSCNRLLSGGLYRPGLTRLGRRPCVRNQNLDQSTAGYRRPCAI